MNVRNTENKPDDKFSNKFVAVGTRVMNGAKWVLTACSATMAQRAARALNEHKPNSRGV
jgi:hypothetical protein